MTIRYFFLGKIFDNSIIIDYSRGARLGRQNLGQRNKVRQNLRINYYESHNMIAVPV